jgi:ABC-type uncharacterized transport system permease subunit
VVVTLFHLTAAVYLAAGLVAGAGLALSKPRLTRLSAWILAAGALLHGFCFSQLHTVDPTPPLTHTSTAISFMAWVGTVGFLLLLWRTRVAGLVVLVAPMAFLGVFNGALRFPSEALEIVEGAGSVPHAHVLLASAGLSLLGLAGLAGALYLGEHRRLKRHRPLASGSTLPSLESLDRAGAVALAVGFPLLTLGVVTGGMWVHRLHGVAWTGAPHEVGSVVAWAVYAVLVTLRFRLHQPARRCAANAIGAFAFLFLAALGVELLT